MKMKFWVTGFLMLVLCASIQLHAQQSDTNPIESIKAKAENGDSNAQRDLGIAYHYGKGVKIDPVEAAKWFRRAAEQGDELAQYMLGNCYVNGSGVATNAVEAIKWWRRSADQNFRDYALDK
jgi:uncharacterized protein